MPGGRTAGSRRYKSSNLLNTAVKMSKGDLV